MRIDTEKFTPLEFCIVVFWLHGWTISAIHRNMGNRHGKTQHAIRGIINRLPRRRSELMKADRQLVLDQLKCDRIDDGMLDAKYFVALPLKDDQKRKAIGPDVRKPKLVVEEPDSSTRAGRREIKRRKAEEEKKKQRELAERERREAGFAPRGVEDAPLEFLLHKGHLADPEDKHRIKERANNAMRRYETGVRLRAMFDSVYGSGLKTQNFDGVGGGGGGQGVVIHASLVENSKNIESIRRMMPAELFAYLENLLLKGLFVWQIPSERGQDIVLTELRDAFDAVSQFFGTMPPEGRDEEKAIPKRANANQIRVATRKANDLIAKAQRSAR